LVETSWHAEARHIDVARVGAAPSPAVRTGVYAIIHGCGRAPQSAYRRRLCSSTWPLLRPPFATTVPAPTDPSRFACRPRKCGIPDGGIPHEGPCRRG